MSLNFNIKIQKKDLWLLAAIFVFLAGVVYVVAYGSGSPSTMGHDAGEVMINIGGTDKPLQQAIDDGLLKRASMSFEVYDLGPVIYACVEKDLTDYCGDKDGCDIRILLQHETDGNDQVKIIDEHIYMEQTDLSNNNGAGIYGWTRQGGGGDYSWITGTANRYTIFSPWDWVWAFNYRHDWCEGQVGNGPAFADPYRFNFMSHPNVRANFIVYD